MALSEDEINALKVPYGRNQFKVSDGGGLYLLVRSSGRYWKLAYRFDGKQKTLTFGVHPGVSLEMAREQRDQAKALLAEGIDPGEIKKQQKAEQRQSVQIDNRPSQNDNNSAFHLAEIDSAEIRQLEARRLAILLLLTKEHRCSTDEASLLKKLHDQSHTISRDRLRTDLAWLSEQHAVVVKPGALWGIYLTQEGFDAAEGQRWIPGITKPDAREQAMN